MWHQITRHLAVPALGDGLALHAELVPGARELGVLPAHQAGAADQAGAAGRERDGGQDWVRGGAHVETSGLATWLIRCHQLCHEVITCDLPRLASAESKRHRSMSNSGKFILMRQKNCFLLK